MVHSTPLVPVLTQPNVRALYHQSRKITTQYHKNRQLWQPNASDATCQRVSSLLRVTLLYIQAGLYLTLYSAQQCTCCQRAVNKSPRNCFFGALVFVLSHRISTISRLLMGTFAILCNRQITASHICLSELQVL